MPNNQWFWVAALLVGLPACAGGAVARAPNGMVPYGSEGDEVAALAASVSPETELAPRFPAAEAPHLAQNDCVQKQSLWTR